MHLIHSERSIENNQADLIKAAMVSFVAMGILAGFYLHEWLRPLQPFLWLFFVGSALTMVRRAFFLKQTKRRYRQSNNAERMRYASRL